MNQTEDAFIELLDDAQIEPGIVRWIDPEYLSWDFPGIAESIEARDIFAWSWSTDSSQLGLELLRSHLEIFPKSELFPGAIVNSR